MMLQKSGADIVLIEHAKFGNARKLLVIDGELERSAEMLHFAIDRGVSGILLAAGVTLTLISFARGEEDDTVARGRVRLTASPGAGFVGVERSLW